MGARRSARGRAAAATTVTALGLALLVGPAAAARPDPRAFLSWNATARVAHLRLVAGLNGSNNGFNYDGYGRGELLVTIPLGWRVVVACENRGNRRHSCAVVKGSLATRPAFPGAASPSPRTGLAPGSSVTFSFRASRVGSFRIACLVPGHEQAREWAVLAIARGAKPTISARGGP